MNRRVVFDCMVFVQALARPRGPAARCLERADSKECELLVSEDTLSELADVVARPNLRRTFIRATDEEVAEFIARVRRIALLVEPIPEAFVLKRDPRDSKYINLAIAANAELIVSRDNDLLDLMTSDDEEPVAFRTAFPAIRILDPVSFLRSFLPEATDSSDEAS